MFRIVAKRHFHAANLQKIIEKQNTSAVYLMQTRIFCQTQRHIINVSPSASPFECFLSLTYNCHIIGPKFTYRKQ